MIRAGAVAFVVLASTAAQAQQQQFGTPTDAVPTSGAPMTVVLLLRNGYDIKSGFSDNTGGAYLVFQKATSAYLCHSGPSPVCTKLN